MILRLLLVPYTFVLLNWAAVQALVWFLRGRGLDGVWADAHRRSSGAGPRRILHPSKP